LPIPPETLELAGLIHIHLSRQQEDLPFWRSLAAQAGGPILELGCGSGRVCLDLAKAGYPVYGLDNDPAMLAVLRARAAGAPAAGLKVVQADMTAFRLAQRFPFVIVPCNTFSLLDGPGRQAALACITEHLAPGGRFAAVLPNPASLAALPRRGRPEVEDLFPHPQDGRPVRVSSAFRRTADAFHLAWHYDHQQADGSYRRLTSKTRHALTPLADSLAELERAGLGVEALYGDFDRSPYQDDSPALIWVARRSQPRR
jgi:SAM-dependent methyltransferase